MGAGEADSVGRAQELLDSFLSSRSGRTSQAYRGDVEDFSRFMDEPPAAAVARLLGAGSGPGQHLVLEFAVYLRRRGRASATVARRLATLHSLLVTACRAGLAGWTLDLPGEEEIAVAVEERALQASYLLPRHPSEIDRLDVQHYAMRAYAGAHYFAPIGRTPLVLDVGTGTGQWALDLLEDLPDARVVGLDLVVGKPALPPGYRVVRGNLLHGLPFRSDRFDFVHQRFLVTGVPVGSWSGVVADLARVAKPGGWVELLEPAMAPDRAGPANERLAGLMQEVAASLGLDSGRVVFDSLDGWLREAGLVDVTRRELAIPVGIWEGQVGALMATDIRAFYTRICEGLLARSRLTRGEVDDLIRRAQEEWEEHRMQWPFAVACGRRP